jgi:hypothetical protein
MRPKHCLDGCHVTMELLGMSEDLWCSAFMHPTPSFLPHFHPAKKCGAGTPKMGERQLSVAQEIQFSWVHYILLPHPCSSDGGGMGGGHESLTLRKPPNKTGATHFLLWQAFFPGRFSQAAGHLARRKSALHLGALFVYNQLGLEIYYKTVFFNNSISYPW